MDIIMIFKSKPQKYLKNMIWMNIELEKIEGKMFQFMPLRSDFNC